MDDDDLIELRALFLDECRENIDLLEQGLMRMGEGESDDDTLNEVFRAAHSIKGGGATFGFVPMSELTHHMETLLDSMRSGRRVVDEVGVDLLLEGLDLVQSLLESAGGGDATADREERPGLEQRLIEAVEGAAEPAAGESGVTVVTEPAEAPAAAALARWTIDFHPNENFFVRGHDPLLLLTELHRLGRCTVAPDISALPPLAGFEPGKSRLRWRIGIETDVGREVLLAVFDWVDQDCAVVVEPLAEAEPGADATGDMWRAPVPRARRRRMPCPPRRRAPLRPTVPRRRPGTLRSRCPRRPRLPPRPRPRRRRPPRASRAPSRPRSASPPRRSIS